MTQVTLHPGDNRVTLRRLIDEGVRVHSVVTDPPYGLVSIQKRFGKEGAKPARTEKNDGSFARLSGGFMGKQWDATGIERDPEFWRLVYDILLPGGYVFAFSGSRTGHWQACAMELAGFVMHPMHGWVFGSGFPKAHAADKAIDKMGGTDRLRFLTNEWKELAGAIREHRKKNNFSAAQMAAHFPEYRAVTANWERTDDGNRIPTEQAYDRLISLIGLPDKWRTLVKAVDLRETIGVATDRRDDGTVYALGHSGELKRSTSPEAAEWEGWAYGTQAQKPALEPIYLGQKPFSEKTGAANLLKHGVGAVNIDGCRVPTTDNLNGGAYATASEGRDDLSAWKEGSGFENGGAGNFVQPAGRHPANLMHDGSPEVVAMFPAKAGAAAPVRGDEPSAAIANVYNARSRTEGAFHGDHGSAARFFHAFPRYACERCLDRGVIEFGGSMSEDPWQEGCPVCEGEAARPMDANPIIYNGKAAKADRAGGNHPTVKPIALMRYLMRHITPPGGTVLDMFAGSGTTAEAARLEGFDCILMEAEPEYVDFLRKRFGLPGAESEFEDLLGLDSISTECGFDELL